MKKLLCAMFAMLGICLCGQETPMETGQEKNPWIPNVEFEVGYASRYMLNSILYNPQNVTTYSLTLDIRGVYANVWTVNDHNRYNHDEKIKYEPEEWDYTFGYRNSFEIDPDGFFKGIDYNAYVCYYDYPKRSGRDVPGEQQWEYTFIANADIPFYPGIKISWDPENESWGGNVNCGYMYNFENLGCKQLSFLTGLELIWANSKAFYNGGKDITFCALDWTSGIEYKFTDNISLLLYGELDFALDHNYRDAWKDVVIDMGDYGIYRIENPNAKSGVNTLWGAKLNFKF